MQDYRSLRVWQQAHSITLRVYRLSATFPAEERFGMAQQIRRAAASVAANIAEGSKRLFKRDYVRFLNVAEGSLREVDYYLVLARDLDFGDATSIVALLRDVDLTARMLTSLRESVQRAGRPASRKRSARLPTPDDAPDP